MYNRCKDKEEDKEVNLERADKTACEARGRERERENCGSLPFFRVVTVANV